MSSDSPDNQTQSLETDTKLLATDHFKHDLTDFDRDNLKSGAKKPRRYAIVGSMIGLGIGLLGAVRVRRARMNLFDAFKLHEKPTHIRFANGREGTLAPSLYVPLSITSFAIKLRLKHSLD